MAIDVLLIREGTKLAAADSLSAESIAMIKAHETVVATIRRPRNPRHHRKLWALLQAVYENQSAYATAPDLLNAIKIATGHFETGKTVDGIPWVAPKSISYVSMDQNSFEQWYERALEVILTKILPRIDKADLQARIDDILNGYAQ